MILPCTDAGGYRKYGFKAGDKLHCGHDFNAPEGTPIKAITKGVVIFSDEVQGFGSFGKPGGVIAIKHGEIIGIYGHLERLKDPGDKVQEGDVIGSLIKYETKNFRADHLHFGIYLSRQLPMFPWGYVDHLGLWTDPLKYIRRF